MILDLALDPWPAGPSFEGGIARLPSKGYTRLVDREGIIVFRRGSS